MTRAERVSEGASEASEALRGPEGLRPVDARRLRDRVLERRALERVEDVVMDEDADRPLRRQEVRDVVDDAAERLRRLRRTLGHTRVTCHTTTL